jgi:hypothetical protein
LKIENYQLADIIFPYLHIFIFPSPEGRKNKRKIEKTKTTQAEQTPPLWRGGWVGSRI